MTSILKMPLFFLAGLGIAVGIVIGAIYCGIVAGISAAMRALDWPG